MGADFGIERVAVVGAGVIGAGWIARLRENGVACDWVDPDPAAPRRVQAVLANAERALSRLSAWPRPLHGEGARAESVSEAVAGADLVIEAVPERLDLKREVYAEIQDTAPGALIASSTSGFKPSDLQAGLAAPGRIFVAHPFNPVYLLPLVELVAGRETDGEAIERASAFLSAIGMKPLVLRREIDAFIADRLMEALWREALWLVHDDVASTGEIDDAIRFGCGLRWAQMGTFQIFDIAGGEAGMRHFMRQFGPALKWPWTKLTDVPEMDEALVEKIARQVEAQAGGRDVRELERIRDDNLVAILKALETTGWGAGAVLGAHEARMRARLGAEPWGADTRAMPLEEAARRPIRTASLRVPGDWLDGSGLMGEARYGQLFGEASSAFLAVIGADAAFEALGTGFRTVETRMRRLASVGALEPIGVDSWVMSSEGGALDLRHELRQLKSGQSLARADHSLAHVTLSTGAPAPLNGPVAERLAAVSSAQTALTPPAWDGGAR